MKTIAALAGLAGLAGLAAAAVACAPVAAAGGPGLASFAGSWHAHGEGLVIDADGHGRESYADRSTCPNAPTSGCGIEGTVDFVLTRVSGEGATGVITASSNPKDTVGGPVSLALAGGGQGLALWIAGGDQGFPFCNNRDDEAASHYYCGA